MLRTDGLVHSVVLQHVPKLCFCPQPHTPLSSHTGFTASPELANFSLETVCFSRADPVGPPRSLRLHSFKAKTCLSWPLSPSISLLCCFHLISVQELEAGALIGQVSTVCEAPLNNPELIYLPPNSTRVLIYSKHVL